MDNLSNRGSIGGEAVEFLGLLSVFWTRMSSKGIDFTRKRWRSKRRQGSNKTEIVFASEHNFTFTLMAVCSEDTFLYLFSFAPFCLLILELTPKNVQTKTRFKISLYFVMFSSSKVIQSKKYFYNPKEARNLAA